MAWFEAEGSCLYSTWHSNLCVHADAVTTQAMLFIISTGILCTSGGLNAISTTVGKSELKHLCPCGF